MMNDRRKRSKNAGTGKTTRSAAEDFVAQSKPLSAPDQSNFHSKGGQGSEPTGMLTHICSISDTGLVFQTNTELTMGAEVSLTVQMKMFGRNQEWLVQGVVVECLSLNPQTDEPVHDACESYKVELWFSHVPRYLKLLLGQVRGNRFYLYPPMKEDSFFGLN